MTNEVFFPGLGLELTLKRVAFSLLGRPIYWYGIIIGVGFLLAVAWCYSQASRYGIKQDDLLDLLIAEVPLCLVGCRAYYVIFYLDLFRDADGTLDWSAVFAISDGGMAIYGGIIMAAIVLAVFCRWKKISFPAFADLGVQGLLIGQLVGRWGNFMNVEAYGGLTKLPWRMCSQSIALELWSKGLLASEEEYFAIMDGTLGVHPTFLYESLWNLIGLGLIIFLSHKAHKFNGQLFLSYVFWYGLGRFWIEGMRTDSLYFFGLELFGTPLRTSQTLAFLSAAVAGGLLLYQLWFRRGQHCPLYVHRMKEELEQQQEEEKTEEKTEEES